MMCEQTSEYCSLLTISCVLSMYSSQGAMSMDGCRRSLLLTCSIIASMIFFLDINISPRISANITMPLRVFGNIKKSEMYAYIYDLYHHIIIIITNLQFIPIEIVLSKMNTVMTTGMRRIQRKIMKPRESKEHPMNVEVD